MTPRQARALRAHRLPGGVFLDVGSHFGLWSVYAAAMTGRAGTVPAFEPSPAFATLHENADLNPPVRAFNVGVGAAGGESTFFDQGAASSVIDHNPNGLFTILATPPSGDRTPSH